jgi:hypothetical protein
MKLARVITPTRDSSNHASLFCVSAGSSTDGERRNAYGDVLRAADEQAKGCFSKIEVESESESASAMEMCGAAAHILPSLSELY